MSAIATAPNPIIEETETDIYSGGPIHNVKAMCLDELARDIVSRETTIEEFENRSLDNMIMSGDAS